MVLRAACCVLRAACHVLRVVLYIACCNKWGMSHIATDAAIEPTQYLGAAGMPGIAALLPIRKLYEEPERALGVADFSGRTALVTGAAGAVGSLAVRPCVRARVRPCVRMCACMYAGMSVCGRASVRPCGRMCACML